MDDGEYINVYDYALVVKAKSGANRVFGGGGGDSAPAEPTPKRFQYLVEHGLRGGKKEAKSIEGGPREHRSTENGPSG